MNCTRVAEQFVIASDVISAEAEVRALLRRAEHDHLHVSIAGARHTLGGHTIAADGIVLSMLPLAHMRLDAASRTLRVGAGARWSAILPYLDQRGYSVAVMQSNDDFTVGGSISVNCHGWQTHTPPIASTVESLRIMQADGVVVVASRTENSELFSLALGGYGLFGVILEVDLRVVPNERLRLETTDISAADYTARFDALVTQRGDASLAYGRLCVVPGDGFLREGLLTVLLHDPCGIEEVPRLAEPSYSTLRRLLFRAQIESDAGKELRWALETRLGEQLFSDVVSRNQMLAEGVEIYGERNADRMDVIQEYFVPPSAFASFLESARLVLQRQSCDLLNVTVRDIERDDDTFLRYADQRLVSAVMVFDAARTPEADERMQALARELIDAAIAVGGRYYLPYRLYATREQFERAYPMASAFFEAQRRYDPHGLFRNSFADRYGPR